MKYETSAGFYSLALYNERVVIGRLLYQDRIKYKEFIHDFGRIDVIGSLILLSIINDI